MAEQLPLDLTVKPALGRADFFVSPANAAAVASIEDPAGWPAGKLALTGPAGAGKTHLVHVWAALSGARIVAAADLPRADIAGLAAGPVAVEDVPEIAGDAAAQEALFHLHNLVLAAGHGLLLTGARSPVRWGLDLPDLASRMAATPTVTLDPPDDALLGAVMMKLFADRQLLPAPDLIPYLVRRIERSFAAAGQIVDRLDRAALSSGRGINRALAARLLDNGARPGR